MDPGDQHLCANWQNFLGVRTTFKSAATHFMAEPDRVYYYVVSDFYIENHGPATIKINPLDSDQAQLLMSKFAFSTSKAKKNRSVRGLSSCVLEDHACPATLASLHLGVTAIES